MTEALALAPAAIEAKTYPRYAEAENLARKVLARMDSLSAKLRDLEADIRRLWAEFDKLKTGETILGCATKKEFCEKKLHRTPRALQYLLAGQSNPADRPRRSELSSPQGMQSPSGQVHVDELPPEVRTKILAEIGEEARTADISEPEMPTSEAKGSRTAELRDWFAMTWKGERSRLRPTEHNGRHGREGRYELTLDGLTPKQVKFIGNCLANMDGLLTLLKRHGSAKSYVRDDVARTERCKIR